jgi:hypothetical protein
MRPVRFYKGDVLDQRYLLQNITVICLFVLTTIDNGKGYRFALPKEEHSRHGKRLVD